jgi:anti-sigma regulatory factor (Ser/Thr protein kinase)
MTQAVKGEILERVAHGDNNPSAWITARFSITRRTASSWLSKLVAEGALSASGSTRKRYLLGTNVSLSFFDSLENLDENQLWLDRIDPFMRSLSANVRNICHYGFTEMVNNAHDHSGGTRVFGKLELDETDIELWIGDDGIGIFKKIQHALNLPDPRQSLLELSKGKFTSDPENHSGEGIFFTSRMFSEFSILSRGLAFAHEQIRVHDYLLEVDDESTGTFVSMKISRNSALEANEIFQKFAPADSFSFDRTIIPMRMARIGDENLVSRSQAKRVVQRFERFKMVELDFTDVNEIGQAFADEIFRVYAKAHPEITLSYSNATGNVEPMILRARKHD